MYLLALSIVFASFNSAVLHKVSLKSAAAVYRFNGICSLVWAIILLALGGKGLEFTHSSVLFGVIYGITQAAFVFFKTAAMNGGSVSVATLVGNGSLVINVLVCRFLWNEPISLADILGLAVLLLSIALISYRKEEKVPGKKGRFFVLVMFLICSAGVGISFKAFAKAAGGEGISTMMAVAAAVMLTVYTVLSAVTSFSEKKHNRISASAGRSFILYAILAGVLSCGYNRLNIWLSGELDGVIFFPGFNGGVVILSAVLSALFFKERFDRRQILGLLLGVVSICIIGIF